VRRLEPWKLKIEIGDLINRSGEQLSSDELNDIAAKLVERLLVKIPEGSRAWDEELESLVMDLREPQFDVDEFDDLLSRLYDWGDAGKRLWVGTMTLPASGVQQHG
jgi:hypothetical protein